MSDLVDGLDLKAFYATYAGDGRRNAPYEPWMMVKLLIYGYATGVFSSRGLAKFGTLSIDGTKVRANASKRKGMTYRRMKGEQRRLEAEIGEWLRRADEIDAEEDAPLRKGSAAG